MRVILIDNYSGFIWGDSADHKGRAFTLDDALAIRVAMGTFRPGMRASQQTEDDFAVAYAAAMDADIGGETRDYEMLSSSAARNGGAGYRAYRADVDGSEAVGVVHDGQDEETIEAVETNCRLLGFIAYRDRD
jgi:hypothetical protein